MIIKLSVNTIIIGLLVIILGIVLFKSGKSMDTKRGKPGIFSDGAASKSSNVRKINITAKQFSFTPNLIKLKVNEPVRLLVNSEDVTHGFTVPQLGIDRIVEPGKETAIEFTPDRKGTYSLLCSVQCGTGHTGMRASIIVE